MKQTINKYKKETGSFINLMMGNNASIPVVGEGATELLWTDRHTYKVIEFDEAKKMCKIQRYEPERIDNYGMSVYKYEKLTEEVKTLVYRNRAWRQKCRSIRYRKDWMDKQPKGTYFFAKNLTPEQHQEIYGCEMHPQNVVEGITEEYFTFPKINIIFGVLDEYYDFSF